MILYDVRKTTTKENEMVYNNSLCRTAYGCISNHTTKEKLCDEQYFWKDSTRQQLVFIEDDDHECYSYCQKILCDLDVKSESLESENKETFKRFGQGEL